MIFLVRNLLRLNLKLKITIEIEPNSQVVIGNQTRDEDFIFTNLQLLSKVGLIHLVDTVSTK